METDLNVASAFLIYPWGDGHWLDEGLDATGESGNLVIGLFKLIDPITRLPHRPITRSKAY